MEKEKQPVVKTTSKGRNVLHDLLMNPKARVWRHLLLVVALLSVSFNQTYIIFQASLPVLGDKIYGIALLSFISYLVVVYYNIYVLIPKYLVKRKYLLYGILMSLSVVVILCVQNTVENTTHAYLGERGGDPLGPVTWINSISSFITISLCMVGGMITVLLKYWMQENQHVNRLEQMHIQSEVEQLKEQVNPQLLFDILDKTGHLAPTAPEDSSRMLFKLSQLLRYQLYDCSRATVLLEAEIRFLSNYLSLVQMYSGRFEYQMSTEGEVRRQFVPPLLFIPFVQWCVTRINEGNRQGVVHLVIKTSPGQVEFNCLHDNEAIPGADDFSRITRRLDFLYGGNYSLSLAEHSIQLILKHARS